MIEALAKSMEPQYSGVSVTLNKALALSTSTLDISLNGKEFEIYRHDPLIVFGMINTAEFEAMQISLRSHEHPKTKKALLGNWTSKDASWLQVPGSEDNDELFKVVARSQINRISKQQEDDRRRYDNHRVQLLDKEIEEISLRFQVMSPQTTFLAVSKND